MISANGIWVVGKKGLTGEDLLLGMWEDVDYHTPTPKFKQKEKNY